MATILKAGTPYFAVDEVADPERVRKHSAKELMRLNAIY